MRNKKGTIESKKTSTNGNDPSTEAKGNGKIVSKKASVTGTQESSRQATRCIIAPGKIHHGKPMEQLTIAEARREWLFICRVGQRPSPELMALCAWEVNVSYPIVTLAEANLMSIADGTSLSKSNLIEQKKIAQREAEAMIKDPIKEGGRKAACSGYWSGRCVCSACLDRF